MRRWSRPKRRGRRLPASNTGPGGSLGARAVRTLARASALLIIALGLVALLYPAGFAAIVAALQPPPALYLAAALRFAIGVTFLAAIPGSRATLPLFFLGVVMVVGGVVTPIIGQGLARPILDAWNEGGVWIVRGWGVAAMGLGGFARWALGPRPAPESLSQAPETDDGGTAR